MSLTPSDWPTTAIAIYAAVVSSVALALEFRRWIDSGPRLRMSLISQARLYGGLVVDEHDYLSVSVTNIGDRTTTVTNLCFHQISGRVAQWKGKWERAALATNVTGTGIPFVLQSGIEWRGLVMYDDEMMQWAKSGKLFAAVYFSHTPKPLLKKITIKDD